MNLTDLTIGAVAAATVTQATVIQQHEPMIAGAAQSLMLAAIVGSLIGVYLHQGRQKGPPLLPVDGSGWRLAAGLAWRVASWGVGVAGFAFIAAWTVTGFCLWKYQQIPPPAPPITGIIGVFIIPLLPKYQAVIEGVADKAGEVLRLIVGKPS